MGDLLNIVTPLHQATQRDYLARMVDNKVEAMLVAKKYEADYWDGDRRYGYGGYNYLPGRWKPVAEASSTGLYSRPATLPTAVRVAGGRASPSPDLCRQP